MAHSTIKTLAATLAAVGMMRTTAACADGLYVDGAVSSPNYQDHVDGIAGSGSGVGGKLGAGYQFGPYVAVEAGGSYLGHIDNSSGKLNGRAAYLDAVGIAPFTSQWSALGSLGVARVRFDTTDGDGSGTGLKLGAGLQYNISSTIAVRGEWERYTPHAFETRPNVDQYSLGVRVGF